MTGQSPATALETTSELRALPPSAKLVVKTLEYEGERTQAGLAESTLLPPRTVRHALSTLEGAGIVTSRISFMDARQRIYTLASDVTGG